MPDPLLAAECSVAGGGAKDLDGKIGAKGKVHPGPRKGLVFKELPEGTRVVAGHGWDCTKFKKFAEHGPDGEWRDGDGNPVGWWVVKDGSGTWGVYFKTLPYCSYWLSTGNGATAASPAGNKYKTSSSYGVSPCPEFTLLTGQQVRRLEEEAALKKKVAEAKKRRQDEEAALAAKVAAAKKQREHDEAEAAEERAHRAKMAALEAELGATTTAVAPHASKAANSAQRPGLPTEGEFLHGELSRGEAESLLRGAGMQEGAFLVRLKGHNRVLSLSTHGRFEHLMMTRANGEWLIGGKPLPVPCPTLTHVIAHLWDNQGPHSHKLTAAVPQKVRVAAHGGAGRASSGGAGPSALPGPWASLDISFFPPRKTFPEVLFSYQTHSTGQQLGKHWVWALAHELLAHGIDTFNGYQVRSGENWVTEYFSMIPDCKVLVAMISKTYFGSTACLDELRAAIGQQKPVIPIFLEAVDTMGHFLGESTQQKKDANLIRVKVLSNNCVPPPDQGFFPGDNAAHFKRNAAMLAKAIRGFL